jgi:hypothetical protein
MMFFGGAGVVGESEASKLQKQVKAHGAVQVFGWGVLLPIGAMVARYARGYDPAWFYIHVTFQMVGFIFIIAGVATGVHLAKSIDTPGLSGHKGLGIFLFILAILQVCPDAPPFQNVCIKEELQVTNALKNELFGYCMIKL